MYRKPAVLGSLLVTILALAACGYFLSLEEQKARIMNGDVQFRVLSSRAFLETWGHPTYRHYERMQFYPIKGGNYVPRFRVPTGEHPPGWTSTVVSEPALFFGYADRGELLGFINDRLVYRERMPAEQVHAVGNVWKRESLFKTRLEMPSAP
jgi:hypothetical protein